jgi:hypothetical protein
VTDTGEVVIPYGKEQVKSAAKASRDHVLNSETENALIEHYELHSTGS